MQNVNARNFNGRVNEIILLARVIPVLAHQDSSALQNAICHVLGIRIYFLYRHGKDIIHQQFLLGRIAQAAIDIYAQTCVLSRCTMNLNARAPSALHEEIIAKVGQPEAQKWGNDFGMFASNKVPFLQILLPSGVGKAVRST